MPDPIEELLKHEKKAFSDSFPNIEDWRADLDKHFPTLAFAAETCLSVICQLRIEDVHNPFCLGLIDRPGSGKTVTVDFFSGCGNLVKMTDEFTPNSFVTNIAGRTEDQLKKIDLLPKIKDKTLLIREMGCINNAQEERLRQLLGILTRVLDGEGLIRDSGTHGERGYSGKFLFSMIFASTPFQLNVWKAMAGLGHRMYFLALYTPQTTEKEALADVTGLSFSSKLSICKEATNHFLQKLWKETEKKVVWDKPKDDKDSLSKIFKLASILCCMRGEIIIFFDRESRTITSTFPQIEDPRRPFQVLYNLARGHALVCGRNYITPDDLDVVIPVVFSTAPTPRPRLLQLLVENAGYLKTNQIVSSLQCVDRTAHKEMHKFIQLGLCNGNITAEEGQELPDMDGTRGLGKYIEIKDEFKWVLTDPRVRRLLDRLPTITKKEQQEMLL